MTLEGISPDQLQMTDTPRLIWIPVREAVKLRWERNPKQHDLGLLSASFRKHGFKQIPHYDSNIGIDDGNGRVECLDWMEKQGQPIVRGIATIPDGMWVMPLIVGVDDKSKALAEAYAIDANNLVLSGGEFAPWEIAKLWDEQSYLSILQELAGGDALPVSVDGEALDSLMQGYDGDGSDRVGEGLRIYSDEQIIDSAFDYFRKTGFPYRDLPIHVSMQEINKLATCDPQTLLHSDYGYHVADTYHPHRFATHVDGMAYSSLEAFNSDRLLQRAARLALDYGYSIPDGAWGQLWIVSGAQSASNFRPGFACYLYRKFCQEGATVLDTSTGYGGRLVGFIASGVAGKYIGIDPNTLTHQGNLRMAQELGFADKIELHNLPAEDVPIETVRGRCDFAFTSPPYFSKEHYSDEPTQSWVRYQTGDAWRDGFLVPMLRLQYEALKPDCYAVVNIADVKIRGQSYPLVGWAREAAQQVGFEYQRTDKFELTRRFGAGMKDEVASEPVLVFHKPVGT